MPPQLAALALLTALTAPVFVACGAERRGSRSSGGGSPSEGEGEGAGEGEGEGAGEGEGEGEGAGEGEGEGEGESGWPLSDTPIEAGELLSIHALGPELVLAGGERGQLIGRYEGGWRRLRSPTDRDIAGVWGSAPDDFYVASREGLHHWDGASYRHVVEGAGLNDVFGVSEHSVWAVGGGGDFDIGGRIYGRTADGWSLLETFDEPSSYGRELHTVWAATAGEVWAAGWAEDGRLYRFEKDIGWTDESPIGAVTYHGIHGAAEDDFWVVGYKYRVLHYVGGTWEQPYDDFPYQYVYDVFAPRASQVWILFEDDEGHGGLMRGVLGAGWQWEELGAADAFPEEHHFSAIHGAGPDAVWVVGGRSASRPDAALVVYAWRGGSWSRELQVQAPAG